jgi:hypothetical protein
MFFFEILEHLEIEQKVQLLRCVQVLKWELKVDRTRAGMFPGLGAEPPLWPQALNVVRASSKDIYETL